MVRITALKCPLCDAKISRNTKKCSYCGIELDISPSHPSLISPTQKKCPECGTNYKVGRYFCKKCGKVLLTDNYLRNTQKEERILQKKRRASLDKDLRPKIELNEYLYGYYLGKHPQDYILTDKRVLIWASPFLRKHRLIGDLQYKDITSIHKPKEKKGLFSVEVDTHSKEKKYFSFEDSKDCFRFHKKLTSVYEDHFNQKKKFRILLFLTDLDKKNRKENIKP